MASKGSYGIKAVHQFLVDMMKNLWEICVCWTSSQKTNEAFVENMRCLNGELNQPSTVHVDTCKQKQKCICTRLMLSLTIDVCKGNVNV